MNRSQDASAAKELAEIIEKLPADDCQIGRELCEKIIRGGPDMIEQLVAMVGDKFGDPDGVKAKYALHGLVHYASRPEGGGDRRLVAETLAAQLAGDHSDELKAFIIRQLQLCRQPGELPALAAMLSSDRLCSPAAQAMAAIGGDGAKKALARALPTADGPRREAIGQAIEFLSHRQ